MSGPRARCRRAFGSGIVVVVDATLPYEERSAGAFRADEWPPRPICKPGNLRIHVAARTLRRKSHFKQVPPVPTINPRTSKRACAMHVVLAVLCARAPNEELPDGLKRTVWVGSMILKTTDPFGGVYGPAIRTVYNGLQVSDSGLPSGAGCSFRLLGGAWPRHNATQALMRFNPVQSGDILVWIGVAGYSEVPWRELRSRNVTLIYFNSEPLTDCPNRRVSFQRPTYTADGQQCVQGRTGCVIDSSIVDELWDYSIHNQRLCRRTPAGVLPPLRLVPPSIATDSPRPAQGRSTAPGLLFLGSIGRNTSAGVARNKCWADLKRSLSDRLQFRMDIRQAPTHHNAARIMMLRTHCMRRRERVWQL